MRPLLMVGFAAVTLVVGVGPAVADEPLTPASLQPCPYTADEIKAALDVAVEKSQVADMAYPGGRDVGCLYSVKDSSTVLIVRQTWDPSSTAEGQSQTSPKRAERGLRAIAGDADGAQWKVRGGNERSVELRYTRGKVKTRVLVQGGDFRDEDMQTKLLKLERVP